MDVVGFQAPAAGDLRRHRLARSALERGVSQRQVEARTDRQRIQPRGPAEQRAQCGIQGHRVGIEHDPPHRAARLRGRHAVRSRCRAHRIDMHAQQSPAARTPGLAARQVSTVPVGSRATTCRSSRSRPPMADSSQCSNAATRSPAAGCRCRCAGAIQPPALPAQHAQLGDVRLALRASGWRRPATDPARSGDSGRSGSRQLTGRPRSRSAG